MISSAGVGGEGWKYIKEIPSSSSSSEEPTICSFASNHPNHSMIQPLPTLIHYCQRYVVDGHVWGKRLIPHGIFTCDHPLFIEPPDDLGQQGGSNSGVDHTSSSTEKDRMNAFMVCSLTQFVNDAMVFFKDHHCDEEGSGGRGNRERRELVPVVNLAKK